MSPSVPDPVVFDADDRRCVAVTGATGFIGRSIVRRLRDHGYKVRVLVRPGGSATTGGDELVPGTLDDFPSLCALVRNAAAVVHCAGVVRAGRADDFRRVNTLGTERLLAAIRAVARPARIMLVSSLAAREPHLSAYASSKRAAEDLVRSSGFEHCIVRPPAVYGPGDQTSLPLFRLLSRPLAVLPGSSRSRFSVIFVDDLARLVATLVERPRWNGDVMEPDDGHPDGYAWEDLATIAGRSLGIGIRPLLMPRWLLWLPSILSQAWPRLFGKLPLITPDKLRELYHDDWVCRSDPRGCMCGWQARTPLSEGFAITMAWYVRNGWQAAPSSFIKMQRDGS